MKIGIIRSIITGVIIPCESLRSEHAAPTAMKTDPNIRIDITRKMKNQPSRWPRNMQRCEIDD